MTYSVILLVVIVLSVESVVKVVRRSFNITHAVPRFTGKLCEDSMQLVGLGPAYRCQRV